MNNLIGFDGSEIELSMEDSVIGHKSIKLIKPANISYWASVHFEIPITENELNKTLMLYCNVKTTAALSCQIYSNTTYKMNLINIPQLNDFTEISGSYTPSEVSTLSLRFVFNPSNKTEAIFYIDNIRVFLQ